MKKADFKRISMSLSKIKKLKPLDLILIAVFSSFLLFFIVMLSRSNEEIEVRVKVTDPNVLYMGMQPTNEFANSFIKGDIEINELGQKVAEIIDIERYYTSQSNQSVYLLIKLKANYNPLQKRYSVKGRPVVFGQPLIFTFQNVKVEGLVVEFPGYQQVKTPRTVLIHTQLRFENRSFSDVYGAPLFLKDVVKKGDVIHDKNGNLIIEVVDVRSEPAKRTLFGSDNHSVVIRDPELVDIYYDLKVEAYETNGKLFIYDYNVLEIGGSLPMVFDNISLWPTILDIQPFESISENDE